MNLIDRAEALRILDVSERQLQNYVKQGKLSIRYVQGKTGKVSRYVEDEVLSLRGEVSCPLHRPAVLEEVKGSEGGELRPSHPSSPLPLDELMERLIGVLSPPSPSSLLPPSELSAKPLLTLREASHLSGLPRRLLKEAISRGDLSGSKIGHSWMVRTKELLSFAESLVPPAPVKGRKGVNTKG